MNFIFILLLIGRVDHLEMAGEGQDGVGASVAFSARRPKL